jgi:hypothetical protein
MLVREGDGTEGKCIGTVSRASPSQGCSLPCGEFGASPLLATTEQSAKSSPLY